MLKKNCACFIFLFFFSAITDSDATFVLKGKLKEDVESAHCIVAATISAKDYQKDSDGEIITILHLSDVEVIKGKPGEIPGQIILRGGVFQGVKRQVLGMPEYDAGNRYIFFLRYDNLTCPIIGLGYRSFPVRTHPGFKKQLVFSHKDEAIEGISDGDLSLGPRLVEKMTESTTAQSIGYPEFRGIIENIMNQPDYKDRSVNIKKIVRAK